MEEFVCITVRSVRGENRTDFSARLSHFWTHMLRNQQADFEKVYAEKTAFEENGDRLTRQYLVQSEVVSVLEQQFEKGGVDYEPIDLDDTYTKYEAVAPEWMQIEH